MAAKKPAKKAASKKDKDLTKTYNPGKKDVSVTYSAGFGPEKRPNITQAQARKMTGVKSYKAKIHQVIQRGQPTEWGGGTSAVLRANKPTKTEMYRAAGKLTPNKPKKRGGSAKKK